MYALRLDRYETRTAYGGREALEAVDGSVDVVLLDRRMPEIPGDEVLGRIRTTGYNCRVIVLTAVDPGPDIVEMHFDDSSKLALLEDEFLSSGGAESEDLADMRDRAAELRAALDDALAEFDDIDTAFRQITRSRT